MASTQIPQNGPFIDALRYGTAYDSADAVHDWIDRGGFFYAGMRTAGASDEFALTFLRNIGSNFQNIIAENNDFSTDPGTLGYLAYKGAQGEKNG